MRAAEKLATDTFPLVMHLAKKMHAQMQKAEFGDLVGYGCLGLMDAVHRFDPARSVPFGAYAARRIVGAMYDGVRAMDWVPVSARRRLKDNHGARYSIVPLEDSLTEEMDIPDGSALDPLDESERIEIRESLGASIRRLSEREQLVMDLYYRQGLRMREIAALVGVTVGRISQIHSGALGSLREMRVLRRYESASHHYSTWNDDTHAE